MRGGQHVWSVAEYLRHLRDVYTAFTIRLHRIRTEDRPMMEPMFNDLRARRFRYNDCDFEAILSELATAVAGFCEQVARTGEGWSVKRCAKVFITSPTSAESAA